MHVQNNIQNIKEFASCISRNTSYPYYGIYKVIQNSEEHERVSALAREVLQNPQCSEDPAIVEKTQSFLHQIKPVARSEIEAIMQHPGNKLVIDRLSEILDPDEIMALLLQSTHIQEIATENPDEIFYMGVKRESQQIQAWRLGRTIAIGGCGRIHALTNLVSDSLQVIKITELARERFYLADALQREFNLLNEIHASEDDRIPGIQAPHHHLFIVSSESPYIAYIAQQVDFDLYSNPTRPNKILDRLSAIEKLIRSQFLFLGLHHLHQKGIVHNDIKPENLCSNGNEFQIIDFGGARKTSEIKLGNVFEIQGLYFTAPMDQAKALAIGCHHQLNRGDSQDKVKQRVQRELGSMRKVYSQAAIESICAYINASILNKKSDEDLMQEAKDLCLKQDVYALGKSLAEIIDWDEIADPKIREAFIKLIRDMQDEDHTKRISSSEAKDRFMTILQENKCI